ncbi:MAG: 16S rRNA (uracil(1498)-N(3))-methyltransferase [Treponemataceae bacterium]|nr:16S rRNA (uracil(1498)-N(3))-methyltransferase [Treponemataceae bacterium]
MRQFLCDSSPDNSGRMVVKGRNFRYLVKVLRLAEGDTFDARLPDGSLVRVSLEKVEQMSALLRLVPSADSADRGTCVCDGLPKRTQGVQASQVQAMAEKNPRLWLFQFLPKAQKMDLIIRQAAECGVSRIIPILGAYSVKNDTSGRIERWERIIREARQQCGSAVATEITEVVGVGAAAEMWKKFSEEIELSSSGELKKNNSCAFLLDENPEVGRKNFTSINKESVTAAALAVGCEGGISKEEREVLMKAGFLPLHFMTNVLRAETAAIYGIAVIQTFFSAE